MIELLKEQFKPEMTQEEKANRLREFLQILALKILYDKGYFKHLAFVGGTALRILFNIRRFSEDLDFSLVAKKGYRFGELNETLMKELKLYGLPVETKPKDTKTVQSCFLKFKGLLKTLGLSALDEQKLSIKIEIDANPPPGWRLQNSLINRIFLFNVVHFDVPSLYATKLHACFFRKYVKGRDFYDLVWYIARKEKPNFTLFNNAVKQTHGYNPKINKRNFKEFLRGKLKGIDFALARKDVRRFLEDENEIKLLDAKLILTNI